MTLEQLREVFQKQQDLAAKFSEVEKLNGYEPLSYPVDIQSRAGQDRLRLFYAFLTEEISEAAIAPDEEFSEEMSDILHFAVEMALMAGVKPEEVHAHAVMEQFEEAPEVDMMHVIIAMGQAMNQLKAKPWKREPKPADPQLVKFHISLAVHNLLLCFGYFNLDPYELYFKKHQVNQERIDTGY